MTIGVFVTMVRYLAVRRLDAHGLGFCSHGLPKVQLCQLQYKYIKKINKKKTRKERREKIQKNTKKHKKIQKIQKIHKHIPKTPS
jgi:hypothetical protein